MADFETETFSKRRTKLELQNFKLTDNPAISYTRCYMMALNLKIMQIVTALDWFNNELDEILQLYPSERDKIQKVFIEAKKREEEEIKTIYKNGKDEGYDQYRMERYL